MQARQRACISSGRVIAPTPLAVAARTVLSPSSENAGTLSAAATMSTSREYCGRRNGCGTPWLREAFWRTQSYFDA